MVSQIQNHLVTKVGVMQSNLVLSLSLLLCKCIYMCVLLMMVPRALHIQGKGFTDVLYSSLILLIVLR